jgi:hypothetical protein
MIKTILISLSPFLLLLGIGQQGMGPGPGTPHSSGGSSAPSYVATCIGQSLFSSPITCNFQNPAGTNISIPSGTNIYVLVVASYNVGNTFTVTDNASDTYSSLDALTANGTSRSGQTFITITGTTENPLTLNLSTSVSGLAPTVTAYAYSGSTGIDTHIMNAQIGPTGTNALTSGSVTTTISNDLCIGLTSNGSSNNTITAGTSTVAWIGDNLSPGGVEQGAEHFVLVSAGAITATFTDSNSFPVPFTSLMCAHP